MLKKIDKDDMFVSDLGWLQSRFHFSFAEYRDINNMNFGVLRVLNDDIIHPQSGFDMHPHRDMEIITYVIDGELTHKDSMENEKTLRRGEVQYLSAGTGIYHSEYNHHKSDDLRLLQIWIMPPQKGLEPIYGEERYKPQERKNRLLKIVSGKEGDAKVKIHQDVNIYVCELDAGKKIKFKVDKNRQIYFVQIEGDAEVGGLHLSKSDALKIVDEEEIDILAVTYVHILFIEMMI